MATSPNYAWAEPDNSSLVKNGASDIRTLGDAIDTSVWNVGFGQAGKNKIINGNFGVWQRGTTIGPVISPGFLADRFSCTQVGESATYSQQTFTPGAAPVAGYESQYFARVATTTAAGVSNYTLFDQRIEDVRTFAGQTMTFSFYAKADATKSISIEVGQVFGSGGSGSVLTNVGKQALSTSWVRYTFTISIPSISGKTLGTGSYLYIRAWLSAGSNFDARTGTLGQQSITFDTWGWQAEYGSKATPFQTASGGSPQAELAMCQRYYYRAGSSDSVAYAPLSNAAFSQSTTITTGAIALPVQMRVPPTSIDSSNVGFRQASGSVVGMTSVTLDTTQGSTTVATIYGTTSVIVANLPGFLVKNNNSAGYLGFSAEL